MNIQADLLVNYKFFKYEKYNLLKEWFTFVVIFHFSISQ